ncbi:MAG: hypothetical protein HC800_03070 [Phormidesmis sp. RL_2_1]|nr:hypothetical protein [Phormidesmis sp. RL_2_1]
MVSRSSKKRFTKPAKKQTKTSAKQGKKRLAKRPGKRIEKTNNGHSDSHSQEELSPRQKLVLEKAAAIRRRENISYISSVVFVCGFIGLLAAMLIEPKLGIALGTVLICLVLSFKYQRLALYAFIIYVPFAGTVIYALGGNDLLQIAKDVFYIPALIGVYQFCRKNRLPIILPKQLKIPLVILLMVVVTTVLLTNVPDQLNGVGGKAPMMMALLGLKILFGYVPLVACIYYLLRDKADLVGLLRIQTTLVLVACGLGLIQYIMLKTGTCAGTTGVGNEMFKASLESRCFVGGSLLYSPDQGQIRLPGTFVAPWQWGWFLISAAFFSFGTTFSDKSPFWRAVGLVSLVSVMVMSVLSGQRIALALVPVAIVVLTVMTGQVTNLKRFIPVGVILGFVLFYLAVSNPEVITARTDSLISRWNASPPHAFIAEQFEFVFKKQEGIFGHGLGRATNSARSFGETVLLETYHPKLIYEIGLPGLIAALMVYTVMTVVTFRAYRGTKDKDLRSYAASMWVFVFFISYCPYYYPLDVDPVAVYYWLAAGIILKIPELERQEREKEAAMAQAALIESGAIEASTPSKSKHRRQNQPTFS